MDMCLFIYHEYALQPPPSPANSRDPKAFMTGSVPHGAALR